ncbi:MAG TPA: carbohydrate ABC transporter permease [Clostridiales bacterium]|nr:carbohydrate ABC transporter permease [Clostridiales bacterium]
MIKAYSSKAASDTSHGLIKKLTLPYMQKKIRRLILLLFRYALIICISYMILYPLLQMLSTSFKHPYDIGSLSSIWIPENITFDNIRIAAIVLNYEKSLLYTFVCTFFVMLLQMFNAAFAGYAFARLKLKGGRLLFGLVLLTIIVPPTSMMLPQYVFFRNFDLFGIFKAITGSKLNLLGKPSSLYLLAALGQGLNAGLFVYIFRQFFRGLPRELEEAAYVDGAGYLRIFFRIVLPSSKPAFLTVGVLSFVWNWNDSYFPRLFNPTDQYLRIRMNTLSAASGGTSNVQLAIGNAISRIPPDIVRLTSQPYDALILTCCSLLIILPLIILFLIIQKHFIEGVERSGIVG